MKPISQSNYIKVMSPYPAHIFAITHPLRPGDLHKTRVNEIIQKQMTRPFCHVAGDDYDEVERSAYLESPGGFK